MIKRGAHGSATGELSDESDPFFVWVYVFTWEFLRSECRACERWSACLEVEHVLDLGSTFSTSNHSSEESDHIW